MVYAQRNGCIYPQDGRQCSHAKRTQTDVITRTELELAEDGLSLLKANAPALPAVIPTGEVPCIGLACELLEPGEHPRRP